MQAPRAVHWTLLILLSLFWGFAFSLIAVGLESFGPLTLVTLRLGIGAATLYLIMRWHGHRLPRESAWWRRFALLSVTGNLVPFILIAWAETRISSAQAGLLMALMPISTLVLAHYFVEGEPFTPRRLTGTLIGFAGVAVLVGGDVLRNLGGAELAAQLAVLAATFAYASNAVYTRRLPSINNLVVATGTLGVGALALLPAALLLEQPWHHLPRPGPLAAVLLLGVVCSGIATWIYFRIVADCGPTFLSIINYLIPAIAFAAGVALLGESARATQFLGLLAILLGITLTRNRGPRPPPRAGTTPGAANS